MSVKDGLYLKIEQIARMRVAGVPQTRIAMEMGMSYDGLNRILKRPEYLEVERDVQAGVLGQMDAKLKKRTDLRFEMADQMEDEAVPEAWKIVIDTLRKKRDLKTALEILDRDPQRQFAKGASGAAAQPTAPTPTASQVDSAALAQAVREADATHAIINKASQQKPAEA